MEELREGGRGVHGEEKREGEGEEREGEGEEEREEEGREAMKGNTNLQLPNESLGAARGVFPEESLHDSHCSVRPPSIASLPPSFSRSS